MIRLKSSKCADFQRLQSLFDKLSGPSGEDTVFGHLRVAGFLLFEYFWSWVCPHHSCWQGSLVACLPMLDVAFAGDSVAWEHP